MNVLSFVSSIFFLLIEIVFIISLSVTIPHKLSLLNTTPAPALYFLSLFATNRRSSSSLNFSEAVLTFSASNLLR